MFGLHRWSHQPKPSGMCALLAVISLSIMGFLPGPGSSHAQIAAGARANYHGGELAEPWTLMLERKGARLAARIAGPVRPRRVHAPIHRKFLPRTVPFHEDFAEGTIIINTEERYLYLVGANASARRYGVGVGRPGFQWTGKQKITRKAEWPSWSLPPAMRRRQPELPSYMPGGPKNPLGARALYLGNSLYRIHGSNNPRSIGQAVSSGCIRMRNDDVIELYEQVDIGALVIVR